MGWHMPAAPSKRPRACLTSLCRQGRAPGGLLLFVGAAVVHAVTFGMARPRLGRRGCGRAGRTTMPRREVAAR
eukprot:11200016-Lingulodinium_polyedra.AAC.1